MKLSIISISLCADRRLDDTIRSVRALASQIRNAGWSAEHLIISPDTGCIKYQSAGTVYIHRDRAGIYDAMNAGLRAFTGEYVLYINGGDLLYDLQPFFRAFSESAKYDIYGFAVMEDRPGGLVRRPRFTSPHPGTIYSRRALSGLEFDTNLPITADRDLFDRCRERGAVILLEQTPISIFMTDGVSSQNRPFRDRMRDTLYEVRHRPFSLVRCWRAIRSVI